MNAKWIIGYSFLVVLIGCGCSDRIRGGSVFHTSPTGSTTRLQQSQDPQAPSTIDNSSERTMTFTLPAGSKIALQNDPTGTMQTSAMASNSGAFFQTTVSSNTPVMVTMKDSLKTSNGAAQKNVIGEMKAKLKSMGIVMWVGIGLFIFGIATFAYPPLRAVIGSMTTSVWITVGGLALIILPVLIVGNEMLILCGVAAAVAIWFLAHRHGTMSAVAKKLEPGKLS